MSGDEVMLGIFAFLGSAMGWLMLFDAAFSPRSVHAPKALRLWLLAGPLLALAGIFVVLRLLASFDVREDWTYLVFYVALGGLWLYLSTRVPTGIHLDDITERGNRAALLAWNGAVLGAGACYAGANVGDGPGWWCVVWAAGLATFGWLATWMVLHAITGIVDHVTIDRDRATGLRAASFLFASGALWGRGAAGDWTSALQTVIEMQAAWPVLILLSKAIVTELVARPTPQRPESGWLLAGVLPALLDIPLVYAGIVVAGPLPDSYAVPT